LQFFFLVSPRVTMTRALVLLSRHRINRSNSVNPSGAYPSSQVLCDVFILTRIAILELRGPRVDLQPYIHTHRTGLMDRPKTNPWQSLGIAAEHCEIPWPDHCLALFR
jgi:hypothetical protein